MEKLVSEQTKDISKKEDNYRSVYENAVEGMFRADASGRFVSVNTAFARMYSFFLFHPPSHRFSLMTLTSKLSPRS